MLHNPCAPSAEISLGDFIAATFDNGMSRQLDQLQALLFEPGSVPLPLGASAVRS